jgi:hypothetical protein
MLKHTIIKRTREILLSIIMCNYIEDIIYNLNTSLSLKNIGPTLNASTTSLATCYTPYRCDQWVGNPCSNSHSGCRRLGTPPTSARVWVCWRADCLSVQSSWAATHPLTTVFAEVHLGPLDGGLRDFSRWVNVLRKSVGQVTRDEVSHLGIGLITKVNQIATPEVGHCLHVGWLLPSGRMLNLSDTKLIS